MEALAVETSFAPDFEAFEAERAGSPEWIARIRHGGRERFERLGFPTPKLEAWKYTGLQPILSTAWARSSRAAAATPDLDSLRVPGAIELVFVDGRFASALSTAGNPPRGLRVATLREAAANPPDALQRFLGTIVPEENAFAALNAAFLDDGLYLEIAEGAVLETPIHVLFTSRDSGAPTVSYPRLFVAAKARSQAAIVETHAGAGAPNLACGVTEILAAAGAVVDHDLVGRDADGAFRIHATAIRQERSSRVTSRSFTISGGFVRNDLDVTLAEEGAECRLDGLYLGAGTRHVDNHTTIDHAAPHGSSRELYKGIMDDTSRGVFHGKVIVRPGAQKTDAMQTNKNLLLSRAALVNSTPALEIFADDVKCKHGSTTGQLDAQALFYLQSRGLGAEAARALLTHAFAADVTGRIRVPAVRQAVEAEIGLRLPGLDAVREALS
jgi:Fe-S cluster assembly protein SufD